jgi:cobalt-zinc-cadmium resistance protein CzcA
VTVLTVAGESANLLSIGAIDFGLIVGATVVLVENVFRRLSQTPAARSVDSSYMLAAALGGFDGKRAVIAAAISEVDTAVLFSALIIVAGLVPLFTLSGIEGRIFAPMAKTYASAIIGELIATFTIAPALSARLLPEGASRMDART